MAWVIKEKYTHYKKIYNVLISYSIGKNIDMFSILNI